MNNDWKNEEGITSASQNRSSLFPFRYVFPVSFTVPSWFSVCCPQIFETESGISSSAKADAFPKKASYWASVPTELSGKLLCANDWLFILPILGKVHPRKVAICLLQRQYLKWDISFFHLYSEHIQFLHYGFDALICPRWFSLLLMSCPYDIVLLRKYLLLQLQIL